jgi:hypothetical protein
MKKNVFLKAIAGITTVAILGVSSLIGVSAASDSKLAISDATGKAGEEVTLTVDITNNPGVRAFTGRFTFDEELTLVGSSDGFLQTNVQSDGNIFAVGGMATSAITEDGAIVSLVFAIPEDAEVGDEFEVKWDALIQFTDGDVDYTPTLDDGVITVVADEEETTPEETTAETTTPATEDVAPKTGASTKGIAATSAVLLAAACSAVALKKKRD